MSSSVKPVGANLVRYFFYAGNTFPPERKTQLIALAYAAAVQKQVAPKAILIRSDLHDSTRINSIHQKDPNGWHGTFCFKNDSQVAGDKHIVTHAYTPGKGIYTLAFAIDASEKPDATLKSSGSAVWPPEIYLEEHTDSPIAYSHI